MKKYLAILIVSLISLFASRVSAYTAPPKPDNGWYIVDQAAKLTEDQIKQLNIKLDNISKSTANEYGALIVPSLNGETIEEVAQTTFRSWGIGKKDLNNGVLVVISVSDRKSRIHTGKGVEGDLPDLLCNDILKKNLNPHLKSGDFYGGLNETFGVLASTVESRHAKVAVKSADNATNPAPNTTSNVNENSANGGFVFAIILAILLVGFLVWYFISENQKQEKEYRRLREEQEELLRKKRYAKEQEQLRERLRKEIEAKDLLEREALILKKKEEAAKIKAAEILRYNADKEEKEYHQKIKDMHSSYVNPIEVTKNHSHTIRPVKPVIKVDRVANVDMAKKPQPIVHSSSNDLNYHHLDKQKREREESERLAKAKRAQEESENYYRRQQQERDAEDRRRRDREEEDRRRRDREEEDRRRSSYSSSSSSYDSGSSWGGGGFGGGDSGGGGSSSDW